MAKKNKRDPDKLSRTVKTEMALGIHQCMIEGMSEVDIIEELGVTAQDFLVAKKFLLDSVGTEQELLSSKERFALYVIQSDRNVTELDGLVNELKDKNQHNLILGAIRLRADIADRVIATGQTLGIVEKEPEKKFIVGGVTISNLKEEELTKGVVEAISGMESMLKKYGGTKLNELTPGTLHYGDSVDLSGKDESVLASPTLRKQGPDKRNKANTSKRNAGRRRVKKGTGG